MHFTFPGPYIVIYLLTKDKQDALLFLNLFEQSILYMFQTD